MFSLNNQNVLITGGLGHLGFSMTKALLKQGANVLILSKSGEKIKKFKLILEKYNNVELYKCDITQKSELENLKIKFKGYKKINCLINNAYFGTAPSFMETKKEDFNLSSDIVINSAHEITKLLKPKLIMAQEVDGNASIINIGSIYGQVSPKPFIYEKTSVSINPLNYGVAKAGLIQMTKYMAVNLAEYSIRCNCVSPGAMPADHSDSLFLKKLKSNIPLGRIGNPEDLQGIIIFLASKESAYITGQNINVDGGWTVW